MIEPASFTKRVFSYLIDLIFAFGLGGGLGSLIFIFTKLSWYFALIATITICYACYLIINVPLMYFTKGYTIGGAFFNIKTVNEDNSVISLTNIWIKCLYLGVIPFTIANAIFMLVIHTQVSVFDRITNTVVVESKSLKQEDFE